MLRESATERYQLVVDGEYYSYITQECPLIASVEQSACTTRAYDEPENILEYVRHPVRRAAPSIRRQVICARSSPNDERQALSAAASRSTSLLSGWLLILFTDSLGVGFAVRIEEVLAALLPRRLEFGRCDIPVWPAFLGNGT